MSDKQWFYAIDGNQNGPVPETQIKNMFDEGQVNEDTLFWTEEMPDWLSASEIVTFETYRKKSPPSLPETSNVSQIRPLVRFAASRRSPDKSRAGRARHLLTHITNIIHK